MIEEPQVVETPSRSPSNVARAGSAPESGRRRLARITVWGGLLAVAAVVSAVLGWTDLLGSSLQLARHLFVLFGAMAFTALIGRLVVQPA
jgi:hypothetical protein